MLILICLFCLHSYFYQFISSQGKNKITNCFSICYPTRNTDDIPFLRNSNFESELAGYHRAYGFTDDFQVKAIGVTADAPSARITLLHDFIWPVMQYQRFVFIFLWRSRLFLNIAGQYICFFI